VLPLANHRDGGIEPVEKLSGQRTIVGTKVGGTYLVQEAFRGKVTARRIMLMERVHSNPLTRGASRSCKSIAEDIVSFISNPDPVDGTQHDRVTRAGNDHASTT